MSDLSKLSDEELVSLLKQEKLVAFREIYKRYWKNLYGAAYKRLKSKELAEEIVQELFTNLWVKRQTIQIKTALAGYLFTAVSHYIIDHYRKELVKTRYTEALKIAYKETDHSTEETILLHDLTNTIESEINQLPDRCRSVYELSRKEYKSNKEIALHLGISEKTVENHLTKALKKLRIGLAHYMMLALFLLMR
ncbi:MAG TPA: RNA polymerase sigma-70 factor [Mucilaginibacter sp.]|jgi:RNA polymerase sigma-70 factor (family 1)|nr:RNA polymerase sigma-70 factor [Mucilaginibacter sp.]